MRNLLFVLIAAIVFFACKNNDTVKTGLTSIQWIDSIKNFGEASEGEKVNITHSFKNTGTEPLIIQEVKPACGCTAPEYDKAPILPGQTGQITSTFDTKNQEEMVYKTVRVITNTKPAQHILIFEGTIKKAN